MPRTRAPQRLCSALIPATLLAMVLAGSEALAHEEPAREIEQLSHRIQSSPATATDLLHRAELYRLCEDWARAEHDLRRVGTMAPGLPDLPLAWAALDLDRGRRVSAARRISALLEQHPTDTRALLLAVRLAHARHDPATQVRLIDRVLPLLPSPPPDLFLEQSRALADLGRPAEALRTLEDGLRRLGPVTSLTHEAARLQAREGHLAAGLARLETLAPQFEHLEPLRQMRRELVELAMAQPSQAPVSRLGDLKPAVDPPGGATVLTPDLSMPPLALGGGLVQPAATTTFVPFTGTWRYDTSGVSLGTAWTATSYPPDAAWPEGPGPLGYGEIYIATHVKEGPTPTLKYPTIYFRYTFTSPAAGAAFTGLTLSVNYDDGFVAHLNGTAIARSDVGAGVVTYETLASSHEAGTPSVINVTNSLPLLQEGTNVLAIEVHQFSLTSNDLVLDAELKASDLAPAPSRGPYLQVATPTSMVVRWRTGLASASVVRFGTSTDTRDGSASDPAVVTEHEVTLTGLQPNTRYWYTPGTPTTPIPIDTTSLTFVTPPLAGTPQPTRFWIVGDSGLPGAGQNAVRDAYLAATVAHRPDLWLMLGDNAYNSGTDAEFQVGLFTPYADILKTTVLWPTRGNHDAIYSGVANDYYDVFSMPTAGEAGGLMSGTEAYYSFDVGDIHVVCLDSEGSNRSPGGAMLTWLANDLAATARTWRIAFWHHPPYTKGSHDSDNILDGVGRMGEMRTNALPILEAAGVDLVLNGHSHSYERSVLLDEHYGVSSTLVDSMKLDTGDGRPGGNGAYEKASAALGPHEGAVFSVVGSSSHVGGGLLNHPAMKVSLNVLGSMILDIDGNRLEAQFIDDAGAVRDSFVLLKGVSSPHTLVSTALAGGGITPLGGTVVATAGSQSYAITPDATHGIADIVVDGVSRGPFATWTFTNVRDDHTIEARFAPASPAIVSILDAPADQGGHVRVRFGASGRDNAAATQPAISYEVYRIPGPLVASPAGRPALIAWEVMDLVGGTPATGAAFYTVDAPTLADSGSSPVLPIARFFVRALTAGPGVFFDSAADSGYSVDNLAPAAPASFTRTFGDLAVELRWPTSPEPDVVFYRLHRDTLPDFTPTQANLIATTPDTVVQGAGSRHNAYALCAVDRNGNVGAYARIQPDVLDVAAAAPGALWLGEVTPNPARGPTRLRFGLPRATQVRVTVYDVSGRVIRVLVEGQRAAGVHDASWDGRDGSGARAPNAIYFYELRVEGRIMTRRLAFVR